MANHIPLNVKIIGANEHESCHLFDLIYNNTSDFQPDIFSTDTEGSNQLNYLLLNSIDKIYAPRYRTLSSKIKSIISFSDPQKFKNLLIKPDKQVNIKRLNQEEDNIKHIIASLLLGDTNQSNIISKLSSHSFNNRTKLALWDMNSVLMTDYLLDFVDSLILRQSVHGALNRGEAYHQLRRHISSVHGKNFRGSSDREIILWNECARLLASSTIYYNAVILNKLMEAYDNNNDDAKSQLLKQFSPVAWTHINYSGRYEILINDDKIDINKIVEMLSKSQMKPN